METLNIQCIEQQQVLITLTLTDSNGAPVDLTKYSVYAASVGAVDPYCRRAARLEWAAAINNECSAFIVTAPGHDIARAPWKYTIYIKNRQLGLEWAVVTGRVELTPRACGTDGISPAAYSISAECTPSGLVNVSLDATVGSISGTLEEVKASAALASTSAANAHADLEDARKAATTAAQAATTAAADAKTAAEAATRAEQAATDAPQACAPFVGQVQAAAVQAQQAATHAEEDANRAATAATTATEKAQVATDAAAAAATSATDLSAARDTAVQASTTAQAAQQTAQLASTTATTAAENAREYAEDAQQAQQAAATSETNASTSAQQASDSASAAAASAQSAHASAATAVSAKSDLETARDTATAAATTATDAATAAATSETNATAAATAAATAQAAAEAAQAQADTDARACAIYDQRVAANATAAADSAAAAATSESAAAASAAAAATAAERTVFEQAATIYAATKNMDDGVVYSGYLGNDVYKYAVAKNSTAVINKFYKSDTVILHGSGYNAIIESNTCKVLFSDDATAVRASSFGAFLDSCYIHLPNVVDISVLCNRWPSYITFSESTKFEKTEIAVEFMSHIFNVKKIQWAAGTTFSSLITATNMFYNSSGIKSLPDDFTFEKVQDARRMLESSGIEKLPQSMNLGSLLRGDTMLKNANKVEIEDIVRVCNTINNLQALPEPKTGSLGLPSVCKHNGENVTSKDYLNLNYPDFLTTLAAKGWTVTFA